MKTTKSTRKQAVAAKRVNTRTKTASTTPHVEPVVHAADTDDTIARLYIKDEFLRAIGKLPEITWTRTIFTMIGNFCVGLGIGWLAAILIETIVLGVLVLTGSGTLAICLWALLVILTVAAAFHVGRALTVASYTKVIDRVAINAWHRVRGVFAREPEGVAA
jgi:hypothetical protein